MTITEHSKILKYTKSIPIVRTNIRVERFGIRLKIKQNKVEKKYIFIKRGKI